MTTTAHTAARTVAETGTAAQSMVTALVAHGVDRVFCVAGESYLALLDALAGEPALDVVTSRHEGSAGFAALADAKLTRRAGVLLVNRGPGAMNAAIALHSARQDGTPLVLIVGQVRRSEIGRSAFQEMDYHTTFADCAKRVWTAHDPGRLAELVTRALRVAESGTPGPAVIVVPEDLFGEPVAAATGGRVRRATIGRADPDDVARAAAMLAAAQRPLLIVGDRLGDERGRQALAHAADTLGVPVLTSNKRQDLLPGDHPAYVGHLTIATQPQRRAALAGADLIIAVGTRLDATTTQTHTLPGPRQPLIHVYPDAQWLGHVHPPELGLDADPAAFLDDLCAAAPPRRPGGDGWTRSLRALEADAGAWHPTTAADGVVFGAVAAAIDQTAAPDAVFTVDAGNFTSWVHRYLPTTGCRRMLGTSASAMGFGVPAGVAAALRHPGRQVYAFVGDGGFLMTGTELATAVHRRCRLIIVIADNSSYGTIRQHQERSYPGRVIATDLVNPDFAAMAWAFGATGLSVNCAEQIEPALQVALNCTGPVVIHVRTSLEWISAFQHLPGLGSPAATPPTEGTHH
ncbi:thiamine pyrophosphate-dependent enzyme [Actinoplanes palleronii]|uniref:Thiamine pyrophosphate protein n=1 Tax=Actinoplanes palleronii TaxID=113570 RepID=A0ABQ4BP30_9ACTN|nr:thiamine pyrophosphate-dependent enzyme [Actinoplanes palleronii]GIE72436.1 thiamine pyrophosphate protein [Actinoplanes palleronii]